MLSAAAGLSMYSLSGFWGVFPQAPPSGICLFTRCGTSDSRPSMPTNTSKR